jgi:high-affinity iron transporter
MDPRRPPRLSLLALVALAWLRAAPAAALTADEQASATRLITLVRAVAEEYREAVDDRGRVVRPIEIEEGRLFLAEARDLAGRLGPAAPADVEARFTAVADALAHGPVDAVTGAADALIAAVTAATGVREISVPSAPPSAARGATLFAANCAGCHGATGAGDGADAAALAVKPADFRDAAFMRGETPTDFFHVISVGRRRAAMPAWDEVLSVQERWDVIAFVWGLHTAPADAAEGRGLFVAHCAGCHGVAADGQGPYAAALGAAVPDLAAPGALALRSDTELYATVRDGIPGTPMPGFARLLDDAQTWRTVAALRALSLGGGPAVRQAAADHTSLAFADVRRLLDAAAAAHARGDAGAAALASDAYLRFEPLEPALGARDPGAVRAVEEAFLTLRAALRTPGADVEPLVLRTRNALAAAEAALASPADAWARFLQSAAIILREGLEVVLILGALLAYVVKTGNPAMRRPIWAGAGLGVLASLGTAALLVTVLAQAPGLGDALEGAAMLLAAVVLFWVSWWMVSKAEAERWQRYIQGKVDRALAAGSGTALGAAAFLAVFREGSETVLFYQALLATAPARDLAVPAGFVAGAVVLAAVYLVLRRFGMRLPIRPFFLATGGFLTAMAITFAGRGVHELQEAGMLGMTRLAWPPEVPLLGVFPTVESLLAQAVLLLPVVYGVVVTLRRRRPAGPEVHVVAERRVAGKGRA